MATRNVLSIDRDYVGDRDGSGVTVADSRRCLVVEVVAQGAFSFCNFAFACASTAFNVAVSNDPDGLFEDSSACIPSGRLQPQSRSLASTRHKCLIRSMFPSVV